MIRVRAQLGPGRTHIEVTGHAESHVCAAVSAITQTALLGLEQIALQHPDLVEIEIIQESQ